jgi:hypothetical protein
MAIQPISLNVKQSEFSEEELLGQVSRISQSRVFEHSQTLQRLLRYLAAKSIEVPGEQIKEYTIGVEALQRRSNFAPEEDTIVRVQIHRLREKLLEYYKGEGVQDPILITIPKGRYLLDCEAMATSALPASTDSAPPAEVLVAEELTNARRGPNAAAETIPQNWSQQLGSATPWSRVGRLALQGAMATAIAAVCFMAGWWVKSGGMGQIADDQKSQNTAATYKSDSVQTFWATILGNDTAPVIAYTEGQYLLDDSNDLFPYMQGAVDDRGARVDPSLARRYAANRALVARAGSVYYENAYTGTGDLQGVAALESFFFRMGLTPTVKASRDVTTEDLKKHCVILVGATFQNFQNLVAHQLPPSGDFVFGKSVDQHEAWNRDIINLHPGQAEAATYGTERDPLTRVLRADYGLVSIQPGIVPGRFIVTLVGSDTTGTEGAALFATSNTGIEAVLSNPGFVKKVGQDRNVPVFQALIRINIAKGSVVLGSSLVTVHPLKAPN